MFRSCSVLNCASKRKDVKLFRFPTREIGLQRWLDCINYEELRNKRAEDLCKRYVCQKHFEQKFIRVSTRYGRTTLHLDAYPTLFSDIEISSGTPKNRYIDQSKSDIVVSEHAYTRKKEHQDHTYYKLECTKKYERIITEIDAENKVIEKDENKENEFEVNKGHENEANKEHENEENRVIENEENRDIENEENRDIENEGNKEIENEEHQATEEEAAITYFENTDIADYVMTWTDDTPSSSDCVNEAPETPIAKDAVFTSCLPSTSKLKVRRRRDNNQKSKNNPPKKFKKSTPNCATPVIKSPKQLKLCHRTASKLDMSKAKSSKKMNRMNPLAKEITWMHESEENKEHGNGEHKENEEGAYITSFENTDLVNYVTTWTEDMHSTSGCVNEATVNPITKDNEYNNYNSPVEIQLIDAVITSMVPSTPTLKVRKRRVDNNKTKQKDNPKRVKKSSPNSAIPVIKSLRQLKHCHKTAKKVNLSKTRSFKKVTDRMDPLAKQIMWMLIQQCTRKGLSTEEKQNALSTLKQVQSVTESCIKFLSSQDTP